MTSKRASAKQATVKRAAKKPPVETITPAVGPNESGLQDLVQSAMHDGRESPPSRGPKGFELPDESAHHDSHAEG